MRSRRLMRNSLGGNSSPRHTREHLHMQLTASHILAVLDQCDEASAFPMLDNGYVYLAANRLSLYRSMSNWAIVIEIFGFSPRAGIPDLHIYTFANQLRDRNTSHEYVSTKAYEQYLANN